MSAAPEAAHFRAVLVEVRLARRRLPHTALGMCVHRLRHDHLEAVQHVTRCRLENRHADAPHYTRLRPRDTCPRVQYFVRERPLIRQICA